jgi:hypothetical protein
MLGGRQRRIEPVNFESLEVAEHLVSESAEIFVDSLVEC